MKLAKAMASIASLTLLSRATGFLRDFVAARLIGAGGMMDAFVAAFRLPNMFRALFAEGAFHSVFVPIFSRSLEKDGKEKAKEIAAKILVSFGLMLLLLTIIMEIFMPQIMLLLASGSGVDQTLAVKLGRIMFPYMAMIALASAGAAMLNSIDQFAKAATLPIILNIGMVLSLFFLKDVAANAAYAYGIGVILSGIVQLLWVGYFCQRYDILPKFSQSLFSPEFMIFIRRLMPGMMAAGVYQINVLLSTRIASDIAGAISWLYYADRLYQLPLGVIGIAASTALLPLISKALEQHDHQLACDQQNKALSLSMIFALPCVFGFWLMGDQAIAIVFQHGKFSADDTKNVFHALKFYAIGLPAAMMIRNLSAGFFGRNDTKTPFISSLVAVVVFVGLNMVFLGLRYRDHGLIALASSISIWAQAVCLAIFLLWRGYWKPNKTLIRSCLVTLIASLPLIAVLMLTRYWLITPQMSFINQFFVFLGSTLLASLLWFIIIWKLRVLKL